MKKVTINVPDDCEVQIVRKEVKFKKGDIIVSCTGLIAVYEKTDFMYGTNPKVVFFSTAYKPDNGFIYLDKIDFGIGTEEDCRKATSDERLTFYIALKKKAETNLKARKVLKEVFNKEVKPIIRTYQDLIDNNKLISGYVILSADSRILKYGKAQCKEINKNTATSEKVARSMLAMAMISQLMPYYGGEITDEEWANDNILKYRIVRVGSYIRALKSTTSCSFLAFHTEEQRDNFLKYNYELVKDYLMLG